MKQQLIVTHIIGKIIAKMCNICIFDINHIAKYLVKYPLCNKETSKQSTKVVKCEALKRKTNIPLPLKHSNIITVNE